MKRKILSISLVLAMTPIVMGAASTPSGGYSVLLEAITSTPCPTSIATTTGRVKPVPATKIAEAFCVQREEIEDLHSDGLGYGEIGKAYALAQATGLSVDELLARHQAGEGWGRIAHDLGFQILGGGANARVVPWKHAETPTPTPTPGR